MERFEYLQNQLKDLRLRSRFRQLRPLVNSAAAVAQIAETGQRVVNFSSNNYLSIADHDKIKKEVQQAVSDFGYGSGGSRLICGTSPTHVGIEREFADFLGFEAALLFSSGWAANQAVLKTIPQKGDLVLLDKLDHASIIDGCLAGEADFRTYRKNRLDRLEKLLTESNHQRKFIVTESVFSMDGELAPLEELIRLRDRYNAYLIVDEAHSIGCLGRCGAGLAEQTGVLDKIDILISPLGKAFAASGAIVAGSRPVVDYLVNGARSFIYSTACSPVNCAAILAALEVVRTEPQRRQSLCELASYARSELQKTGFEIGRSETYIIPVILGRDETALKAAAKLLEDGYFVVAIRPPTVPPGSARLRISLQADHTKAQIDGLIESLVAFRTDNHL
ncbi:8-amino-7-oxononanoate synthase [Anaerohalosphaera lusitana]|uniref:8-amino-7-oxononanoate synthase n=1 Tax=Anaerohalosphaera lusitana TaxID=1936003 RepID=A0A1U9NM49_9BACT|nr:8-amino-7-oxononanoate synthase [Anaerohalosphaera lusitana]AQT69022.1 8-amino-7-oxononanoate synthase [Anaerohalosphaera lusitana]